jgi:hypothetical protein
MNDSVFGVNPDIVIWFCLRNSGFFRFVHYDLNSGISSPSGTVRLFKPASLSGV